MAVIVDRGMREMLLEQQDVFYYITLMNENYAQPDLPAGVEDALLRGCYLFARCDAGLPEERQAAELLHAQGIATDVFSVTSWSELARDGQRCEQASMLGTGHDAAFITRLLAGTRGPVLAASDYVRAVPESIRAFMPEGRRYVTLGTDGFGRSDTRSALRAFFRVDAASIAQTARYALGAQPL